MSIPKRIKLFVDPAVQGVLVRRALIYWAACVLFIVLPFLIGKTLVEPSKFFFEDLGSLRGQFGPILVCALLGLPLLVYDVIQLTNRFAGPVYRLRREMQRLANGEAVRPIYFRDGDYWQELATSFNQIAERLQQIAPAQPDDAPAEKPPSTARERDDLSPQSTRLPVG